MDLDATREAARRLFACLMRLAVATLIAPGDPILWETAAEIEEGFYTDAEEQWSQILTGWDLSNNASCTQLDQLMQEALLSAESDVRDRFSEQVEAGVLESMFRAFRGFAGNKIAEVTS